MVCMHSWYVRMGVCVPAASTTPSPGAYDVTVTAFGPQAVLPTSGAYPFWWTRLARLNRRVCMTGQSLISYLHVSPCFAATMRFGTSSRDAAAIKSSTPGPAYVPESTIGAEAPAFSFGKVCVVCVVYAYMCACVCVCVYSQDMFECVGTCAWACCPFRRECFDEGVTSAFPSLACGLARSSGDRVRYRPAC